MKTTFQHPGTLALAVLMLLFGAIYGRGGLALLGEWAAISPVLAACAVLFLFCGAVMVGCGLWLLVRRGGGFYRPLWIGGSATALCGLVILAGVLSKVIPCAGPS